MVYLFIVFIVFLTQGIGGWIHMKTQRYSNSQIINGIALCFSVFFLFSAFVAAHYTGEWGYVFYNWYLIMISPCPLVTDYFAVGGLASALLNAGACGMTCFLFMVCLKGESHANTMAGYFLVVAHCFYGLNFFNMWPCLLAPFIYLHHKRLDFKSNLHVCMFATSFAPFISEFLFRYTQRSHFIFGQANLTRSGVALAFLFSLMLGYVIPAILPGAKGLAPRAITCTTAVWPSGSSAFSSTTSCTRPWA